MQGLNDRQEEACSYVEGPLLILAGAGSGKTRVITHRIAYLIEECNVNPFNILAITFTNKAAKEMRERVDNLIGFGAESVWVSTFHSMCVRILRRFYDRLGGNNNFSIYDTDEQKTVMKEVLRLLNLDPKQYPEKKILSIISKAKEEYISPDDMERQSFGNFGDIKIAQCYREYQKRLKANNALDFDDLIFKTIQLFERHPDVLEMYQERFKYIMVDEYQDTNHTQFILVKQLSAKYRNLCVVGDDDQSIYKFRGADISNILDFESVFPDAKVVRLEQNYRSTSNILNAANAVIANNRGRKKKTLWTDKGDGEKIHFTKYENEFIEAQRVTEKILEINEKGVPLSDIAVLYRTNMQSRVLEEKLILTSTPYKIYGGQNFYGRKEIRDIVSYLKAIDNPADGSSFKRIINVPRRGIGDTTVNRIWDYAAENDMSVYDAMLMADKLPDIKRAAGKIGEFVKLMEGLRELSREGDITALYDEIMDKTGYKVELEAEGTDEAKARLENLEELRNKIIQYERDAEEPSLTELLEDIALVADVDNEDGLEDGALGGNGFVTLMTLHSAKGLEFPYLFIVGMEERLFPSGLSMDSGDPDDLEEERRLCYVGITRAMKELYLSAAASRMVSGSRIYPSESRFIEEIPDELIDMKEEFPGMRRNAFDNGAFGGRGSSGGYGSTSYGGGSYGSGSGSFGSSYGSGSGSYGSSSGGRGTSYGCSDRGGSGAGSSYGSTTGSRSRSTTGRSAFASYGGTNPYKKEAPSGGGSFTVDYAVGDTVKHIKFGKGRVTELIKTGNEYEVTVDFDRVGEKKMFASLARLKKL